MLLSKTPAKARAGPTQVALECCELTLETMTKLAMAIGGKVQARIADADARVLRPNTSTAAWRLRAISRPRAAKTVRDRAKSAATSRR